MPTRGVDAIKVVCDSMLEGLARCLRKCGVDAISIDNSKDHDICINIAQQQQRIILTRGTAFNRVGNIHIILDLYNTIKLLVKNNFQ